MPIDWFDVVARLLAGLALFLFGLDQISLALTRLAGDRMRLMLRTLTINRFAGALTGATATGILQGSSITTVLLVGFVSAGLMSLEQSVPVIFGANVGSTVTTQLIAFQLTQVGLLMIAGGFALLFVGRRGWMRDWGGLIMGLGLIFFGMEMMGDGTAPLHDHPGFLALMARMEQPLLAMAVGAAVTALIQSSAATVGMAIILASQAMQGPDGPIPMLSLEAGIAIALGARIGTCVTAMLAAIGKTRTAVQAAVVHVLFNLIGAVIWIGLIDQLADLSRLLTSGDPTASVARDIANAHTLFNVFNLILFLPITAVFVYLARHIVPPGPPEDDTGPVRPLHLDAALLAQADLALAAVRMELVHLGRRTRDLLQRTPSAVLDGSERDLAALEWRDDAIDALHTAVVDYCRQIAASDLSQRQTAFLSGDLAIAAACESIADIITTTLVASGRSRLARRVVISPQTRERILAFHAEILADLDRLVAALLEADTGIARQVAERKTDVRALHDALDAHLEQRLLADDPHRVHAYSLERDLVDNLHRIYYHTKRAAKSLL